jgi:transcriptional regulator with XRE-family HTH domain
VPKKAPGVLTISTEQAACLEQDCLRLRQQGWSINTIAQKTGLTPTAVERAVKKHLSNPQAETTEQLRALEGMRLDRLLRAIWPRAREGDLKACDRVLRIMAMRAQLFGLSMPDKLEVKASIQRDKLNLASLTMAELDELDAIMSKASPEMLEPGDQPARITDVTEVE